MDLHAAYTEPGILPACFKDSSERASIIEAAGRAQQQRSLVPHELWKLPCWCQQLDHFFTYEGHARTIGTSVPNLSERSAPCGPRRPHSPACVLYAPQAFHPCQPWCHSSSHLSLRGVPVSVSDDCLLDLWDKQLCKNAACFFLHGPCYILCAGGSASLIATIFDPLHEPAAMSNFPSSCSVLS